MLGYPSVATKVLIREGERQRRRYKGCSRCQSEAMAGREPQAEECRLPPEAGKDKEQILPLRFQKESSLTNMVTLVSQVQCQTSALQSYKIINMCCFKPISFVLT